MATKKGVWNLQQVRDKLLQNIWNYASYAVEGSGELWVWGRNTTGGLGQNNRTNYSSPIQIPGTTWMQVKGGSNPGGKDSLIGVKNDGTLWAWGDGATGTLAQNNEVQYSSPVQIPGTAWIWPQSSYGGGDQCGAVRTDGTIWVWGSNDKGGLGQNNTTNYSSPVQVGSDTTWSTDMNMFTMNYKGCYAIKTDGTLWSWGYNYKGMLGQNNEVNYSSPVQIPGTTWKALSDGGRYGVGALKTDGTLWVWGANDYGCLGLNQATSVGVSSPTQVGSGTDWEWLNYDQMDSFGRKTDGTLWAWGYNASGELALNDVVHRSSPTQIGSDTTWNLTQFNRHGAVKTDGTLWTWGRGSVDGSIGQNSAVDISSPVQLGSDSDWMKYTIGNYKGIAIKEA